MSSVGASSYLPPIGPEHEREGLGRELEAVLHELIDLSLIGKQLHWSILGPSALPLHEHLDGLVDSWRELADTVAERAVALGFVPNGQVKAVAAASQLAPVAQQPTEDHVVVRELTRRVAEVSERVRERLDRVGEGDLVSQDVLIQVVKELEKQQWLLRIQLSGRA